jgi:hypothetical protein
MYHPVCILVMAHSHEELLLKLLASLQHQQVLVFVHIDKKSQALFEKLSKQPGIHLVQNRVNVQWAHISQVEAVFTSYKEIKAAGHEAGHWIVISGQDYPVQAIDKLVHFLSLQPTKSFISSSPLSKEGWPAARKRYRYHYYIPMEKFWRGVMMLTGIRRKFPLGLQPYGGSQWINLAGKHMDHIVDYCNRNSELMKFMKTARFPEEMLFQSILMNSEYKNDCINNDLRFVKWEEGKSNPEILTEQYYEAIGQAKEKFFARKFDLSRSAKLIGLLEEQHK